MIDERENREIGAWSRGANKRRDSISGEYNLSAVIVMQEAARRLGIVMTTSDMNQAGESAVPVKDNSIWVRVYTKDPEDDTRFWDKVREIKEEISSNPILR